MQSLLAADDETPERLVKEGRAVAESRFAETSGNFSPDSKHVVYTSDESGQSDVYVVNLDGTGASEISTGIAFFDHMLTLFSRHALIDLKVKADGDTDGYGAGPAVEACDAPSGYVDNDTDCDDASASFHPGAMRKQSLTVCARVATSRKAP